MTPGQVLVFTGMEEQLLRVARSLAAVPWLTTPFGTLPGSSLSLGQKGSLSYEVISEMDNAVENALQCLTVTADLGMGACVSM